MKKFSFSIIGISALFLNLVTMLNARAGTEIGNGGDGIVATDLFGHKFVFMYDLYESKIITPDYFKNRGVRLDQEKNQLSSRVETAVKKAFALQIKDGSLMQVCKDTYYGCANEQDAMYLVEEGRTLIDLRVEAIAWHLSTVASRHPSLVDAIIDNLAELKFITASADLLPNADTRSQLDLSSDSNASVSNVKMIGCANHLRGEVLLSPSCVGKNISASHFAALAIHESLYSLLIKKEPNVESSRPVRMAVAEIIQKGSADVEVSEAEDKAIMEISKRIKVEQAQ